MKLNLGYRPIALYNTEKKELIAVFKYKILAARYIFEKYDCYKAQRVEESIKNLGCINKGTIFDFKVTFRYANSKQIELLGDKEYIIMDGYPEAIKTRMIGFNMYNKIIKSVIILLLFTAGCSTQRKIVIKYDSKHWHQVPLTKQDSLIFFPLKP